MPSILGNGTYHPSSITLWDKSREKGTMEVFGKVVTATIVSTDVVNFTAQSVAWAAFLNSVLGMSNGLIYASRWVNYVVANAYPEDSAINQLAVREIGLQTLYIDATTQQRKHATLPCLDLSLVTYLSQARDFVAITEEQGAGAEMMAYIAGFEGFVVNDATGNATVVVGAKVVGRNN